MELYMVTIDVIGDDYGTNTQLVGIYDTFEQAQKAKEENVYRYSTTHCRKEFREVKETEAVIQVVEMNKTYNICEDAYSAIDEGAIQLGCYIE